MIMKHELVLLATILVSGFCGLMVGLLCVSIWHIIGEIRDDRYWLKETNKLLKK